MSEIDNFNFQLEKAGLVDTADHKSQGYDLKATICSVLLGVSVGGIPLAMEKDKSAAVVLVGVGIVAALGLASQGNKCIEMKSTKRDASWAVDWEDLKQAEQRHDNIVHRWF